MSVLDAQNALFRISAKMSSVEKKLETIKTSITVAENAHSLVQPSVDNDKGYCYYVKERDNASRYKEEAVRDIQSKIDTLEAKKDIFIEDLDKKKDALVDEMKRKVDEIERRKESYRKEIDAKIESLERKRSDTREEYDRKAEYHAKSALAMADKLQSTTPTSLAYRKLVAALKEAENERDTVALDYQNALADMMTANAKQAERDMKQEQFRLQQIAFEKKMEDDKAMKEIETRRERERAEEMKRYREREAAAKQPPPPPPNPISAPPSQKSSPTKKNKGGAKMAVAWPLTPTRDYSRLELESIEITEQMVAEEENFAIYEDRFAYRNFLDRVPGWADSKYAKEGIE